MSFKLGFYIKNILCPITVLFLFSIPTFCQSTKPKLIEKTRAKSQSKPLTLTPDNLQKEAYKMWVHWYKAKQQGKAYPQPTLDIPNYLDAKEVSQVRMAWQQAQQQAQRDVQQFQGNVIKRMDMASAYKIWAEWYLGQHQGKNVAMPNLVVRNIDEKEAKRIQGIWQQAQLKAQNDIKNQLANNKKPQLTQVNNSIESVQTVSSVQANSPSNFMVSPTPNTRLFAGQEYDADLGLYYSRNRYLKTSSGRFITQDSFEGDIEEPASLHKYIYAHNNPINKLDPTGNFAVNVAIGNNFRTAFATTSTFGNIANPTSKIFNQSDPFPVLKGERLLLAKEGLFQALAVTATNSACDKALDKDFNIPSLFANVATVFNDNKIYDGTMSTAYSEIDKRDVSDVMESIRPSVAFAMTPNRKTDLRESFSPPIIFLGKYFFDKNNFNKDKTDLEFRSIVFLHESIHYAGERGHSRFGGTKSLNLKISTPCFPNYKNSALF